MTEQTLLAEARRADGQRSAAADELGAAGDLTGVTLSAGALGALCDLLTLANAQRDGTEDTGEATDPVRRLRLTVGPNAGRDAVITTTAGTLTLRDSAVKITTNFR